MGRDPVNERRERPFEIYERDERTEDEKRRKDVCYFRMGNYHMFSAQIKYFLTKNDNYIRIIKNYK